MRALIVLLVLAFASAAEARRPAVDQPGLTLGEFELAARAVVDGDTLRVKGLGDSLRLIALDTEETFKSAAEKKAFASQPLADYLRAGRGSSPRPVKLPTPLGEDARTFARTYFAGVTRVRLERDHEQEVRDGFDRLLVYVFVEKDGRWENYNLACVRAGMSPYFSKYGWSRRFHADFLAAQAEAQKAGRGIWSPGGGHYDDYPERLAWWNARAEQVARFEKIAGGIVLSRADAIARLEAAEGQDATVLGTVAHVSPPSGRRPARIELALAGGGRWALIVFDRDVLTAVGKAVPFDGFVQVSGPVTRYKYRRSGRQELQMVVRRAEQVRVP